MLPVKDGEPVRAPFTADEFEKVYLALTKAKSLDLEDEQVLDEVRMKKIAPIVKLERDNDRTISGLFKSSYFGHSFENTTKGDIPADSVNLRPFFFQLYLSESGRIYISSQYLGLYGGYTQIKNTVVSALADRSQIQSRSFNVAALDLDNVDIKTVEIEYARKSSSISKGNILGKRGIFVLKPEDSEDQEFEKAIHKKLLDKFPFSSASAVKKEIASILKKGELIELDDDEIESCKLVIRTEGKTRNLFILAGANFASRFTVNVTKSDNGHPRYKPLKKRVSELFTKQILSIKEDV